MLLFTTVPPLLFFGCMKSRDLLYVLFITILLAPLAVSQDNASRDRVAGTASASSAPSATTAAAWDVLDKGLSHAGSDHRRQALLAVGSIGPTPQTLKILESALQDKSPIVRQTAAAQLGELKAPESIPFLQQALDDDNEVSFTAARALWGMGDTSGRTILEQVFTGERSDQPKFLDQKWREARHKLRHPTQLALMGVNEASGTLLGPGATGIIAAEEAIKNLNGSRKSAIPGRALAASALTQNPDNYTRILLEWALDDSSSTVRAAAAKGLGQCGNAESIAKLQPLLSSGHPAVRYMAAASIIRLSEPK